MGKQVYKIQFEINPPLMFSSKSERAHKKVEMQAMAGRSMISITSAHFGARHEGDEKENIPPDARQARFIPTAERPTTLSNAGDQASRSKRRGARGRPRGATDRQAPRLSSIRSPMVQSAREPTIAVPSPRVRSPRVRKSPKVRSPYTRRWVTQEELTRQHEMMGMVPLKPEESPQAKQGWLSRLRDFRKVASLDFVNTPRSIYEEKSDQFVCAASRDRPSMANESQADVRRRLFSARPQPEARTGQASSAGPSGAGNIPKIEKNLTDRFEKTMNLSDSDSDEEL